jgi:hypothetical protein
MKTCRKSENASFIQQAAKREATFGQRLVEQFGGRKKESS